MRIQPNYSIGLVVAIALVTTGCPKGDDDGTDEVGETDDTTGDTTDEATDDATDEATTDTTDDTTDDATDEATDESTDETGDEGCPTHDPGEGAADGEACLANSACMSKVCVLFQDSPPLEGTCEAAPTMCETRFTGRLLDFETGMAVEGIDIKVAAALQAALMPETATALAMGTSDANGQIDFTSDAQISAPLGLVGLTSANGYFLTATGLASPAMMSFYGPANAIHDIWAVPDDLLTSYSMMLEPDAAFANQLPLGELGGVVGLVRDAATGTPIAGAEIISTDADTSGAVIRYLNEAGDGFVEGVTTSNGVFVLVKPGLGEVFGLEVDGVPIDGETGTAGSANGAIFTLIFNITV
jgi:hypothetical protein